MLGFELEVMSRKIDRFGWDNMPDAVKDRLLADWMNALQDYRLKEVQAAIGSLLRNGVKSPNEQQVARQVLADRSRTLAALPKPVEAEPQRERASAEAAAKIIAEVGFKPKRFGGAA